MKRPYFLQWQVDEPRTAHPYRDTMIVYGVLAVLIVGMAAVTGGDIGKALVIAALFYVAATAWSLASWRRRLRRRRSAAQGGAEE
jgi:hypothetical protein